MQLMGVRSEYTNDAPETHRDLVRTEMSAFRPLLESPVLGRIAVIPEVSGWPTFPHAYGMYDAASSFGPQTTPEPESPYSETTALESRGPRRQALVAGREVRNPQQRVFAVEVVGRSSSLGLWHGLCRWGD
jgi:hypothetical protein